MDKSSKVKEDCPNYNKNPKACVVCDNRHICYPNLFPEKLTPKRKKNLEDLLSLSENR